MKPRKAAAPEVLAATPVRVKIPEPIVFPNPNMTSAQSVYVRLKRPSLFFYGALALSSSSEFIL